MQHNLFILTIINKVQTCKHFSHSFIELCPRYSLTSVAVTNLFMSVSVPPVHVGLATAVSAVQLVSCMPLQMVIQQTLGWQALLTQVTLIWQGMNFQVCLHIPASMETFATDFTREWSMVSVSVHMTFKSVQVKKLLTTNWANFVFLLYMNIPNVQL